MDYFFISVLGFALGIIACSTLALGWGSVLFVAVLSGTFFILWYAHPEKLFATCALALIAFSLGLARTELAQKTMPRPFLPLVGANVLLHGTIAVDPDIRETSQRVTVMVTYGDATSLILAVAPLYPSVSYGEAITVSGTFLKPEPFATDGGRTFAYDTFLAKDGVFALIKDAHIQSTAPPSGFFTRAIGMLYRAKHIFTNGIENALPEPSAALAEGLLTGGKQGLGKELVNAFTISGLIQIVVLSGYNVMIIAEAVLRGLSFLPKRIALSSAGISILLFVVAAGSGTSALRAGLMACLALYARASGRTYNALRALFFVLLVMLMWNPFSLVYDPGFELSFLATLGLIIGTPLVEVRLLFIKNMFLREIVATTLAAQIAVLPFLVYLTGNFSLVSLPANILVLPVIPFTMLLSCIAGIVGMVIPWIAPFIGIPAFMFLSYIISVGIYSAQLPFAHVIIPAFSFFFVVLMYALLWRWVVRLQRLPKPRTLRIRT